MTERAYSFIEWKSVDSEQRLLEGWATRVEPDRASDVVEPRGAVFKLPLPLLMDHDAKAAVGSVIDAKVTDTGIRFKAKIAKIAEPGAMKELCDSAWTAAREGLRRAVSIGFMPLRSEPLAGGGMRFLAWDWYELSMVSVPCAPGATIDSIKSFDRQLLAKRAPCRVVRLDKPVGAPRKTLPVVRLSTPLSTSTTERPIAAAIKAQLDRNQASIEEAARRKELGGATSMLLDALAAGTKATDAELAEIRAEIASLKGRP